MGTSPITYNPAGQIKTRPLSNDAYAFTKGNVSETGVANGLNQLNPYAGKTLTHDTNGNVTGFGTESFTYSSENLLKTGPSSTTLTYDPLTRLYQSVSGATTSRFAYDGLNALAEYSASNALQRRWVYDPDGQPVLWYEGTGLTTRRFLSADERGSIISTSDSTGAKLAINTYDEFGNPAGTNSGRYGYTGQAWLPSVTLWYYKARAYEPQLGRFLQPDPADYSQSPNLYAYVLNDPINLVDPFGLQACSGDSCPRGGIQVVGQRLTFIWWPRMTMLIVDRAFDFGSDSGGGGARGSEPTATCPSHPILGAIGKIWAAPNTAIGALAGIGSAAIGKLMGYNPTISFGNNSIQIANAATINNRAYTIGNVQVYAPGRGPNIVQPSYSGAIVNVGKHEEAHTVQSQILGPLYLPVAILGGRLGNANPIETGADKYAGGGSCTGF